MKVAATGIAQPGFWIFDQDLEISLLLVGIADALGVFAELAGVISAGHQVFEKNGMRNADGP